MKKYQMAFTICDKPMFHVDAFTNTPQSREIFITAIREYHKNTLEDLNSQVSSTTDEKKLDELNLLIGRFKARQYFVDKHERIFLEVGKTPMSALSAYDIKVIS